MKKLLFALLVVLLALPAVAQEMTEPPTIQVSEIGLEYIIDVTGNGVLTVEVYGLKNGSEGLYEDIIISAQANESYHYVLPRPYEASEGCECIVKAVAQEEGKLPSEEVTQSFYLTPLFLMPTPEISLSETEEGLYIDVQGQGQLTVYVTINDDERMTVDQLPYFVPRTYEDQNIFIEAIAEGYGQLDIIPSMATETYVLSAAPVPPDPLVVPMPYINIEEEADCVIIYAYDSHNPYDPDDPFGEVAVYLYIDGQEVDNPCVIPRTDELQDLGVSAYAVSLSNPDALQSDWVTAVCIVEPLVQPTETTLAPVAATTSYVDKYVVSLSDDDEASDIYYRVGIYNEETYDFVFEDWMLYQDDLVFTVPGTYRVEAYAIAPNKLESVTIAVTFTFQLPTYDRIYDFVEDGVYYKITAEGKVAVCCKTTAYNSYSGQVDIPATVTHEGVNYMVTAIMENAFRGCDGLTGITIGAYVTSIGNRAFYQCTALTSITLGDYVITVGNEAFNGCRSLASVTLGSGVAQIGAEAFRGCIALTSVTSKAATPPVMAASNCFDCYDTATLYVHPAVFDSYQAANYWKQFVNIVAEDKVAPVNGDANGDGKLTISDVSTLINMLLSGQ